MTSATVTEEPMAAPTAPAALFRPEEVEAFHAADRMAATAIASILMAITMLGLIGYIAIAFWVWDG